MCHFIKTTVLAKVNKNSTPVCLSGNVTFENDLFLQEMNNNLEVRLAITFYRKSFISWRCHVMNELKQCLTYLNAIPVFSARMVLMNQSVDFGQTQNAFLYCWFLTGISLLLTGNTGDRHNALIALITLMKHQKYFLA